jgi:hypothetical protein
MIEKNWRAIGLALLAANLVFMALLELQRRTIWQGERDYFARIEQTIKATDKSQASYDHLLEKQLSDINARLAGVDARLNNVEIKVLEVPAHVALTRDMSARIRALQIAVGEMSAAKQ